MSKLDWIFQTLNLKRINQQIFVLMVITITIPLLIISAIIYYYSVQSVKNEYKNSSNLILNNLSFNIDQYLHSIEQGTLTALMDVELQDALSNWSSNGSKEIDFESIKFENAIEHFNNTIEITIKNVDSVRIYVGNQVFYSTLIKREEFSSGDVTNEEWYKETLKRKGAIVLLGTHIPFHRESASEPVLSIARVINKKGSRDPLGILLIDLRQDSLREILNLSENHNRNFFIIDRNGNVIYDSINPLVSSETELDSTNKQSLATVLHNEQGSYYAPIDGKKSFINYVTSSYSGWKIVQYTDEKEITKHADMLRYITLGSAFCSLVTALVFMLLLSSRITRPINFLRKQVELVGKGMFNVNLKTTRQDEFGVLYRGISKMVKDIQDYIERASILKAQQKISQYRALKSQINPHFLANALETIQMKAVLNKQREISEMIGILGRLFRSHIQTGKETVTLEEELNHSRLYVKVQQMRFGDKIQYIENLAPHSGSVRLLHFSLQPLIENSIVHGIERKSGPGILEVSTAYSENDLLIMVRDNGVGMDETQLQQLRNQLAENRDTMIAPHIGIKNVHDQIRYFFGNQYGLEITSALGEGTTVTMRIPIY
ncbi:cache domain-containing sensor histidine kinase [Fredinandcohnia sp. 179-A 10B2 NHS]|uniref:cache domain-containing sensor histidine kinase n=1 Tax=Fredinandcohnia sp. 179-A 10B2 NHS TaxID=3235176 RepID=UPI00399F63E2